MAFEDKDKSEDVSEASETVEGAILDAVSEATKDPDDDDGPRQNAIMRWLNFLVIMIFLGAIVAGLTAWWTYDFSNGARVRHGVRDDKPITDQQWGDLKHRTERNAIVGFVLGAAIGGVYMVKCLIRGVDP